VRAAVIFVFVIGAACRPATRPPAQPPASAAALAADIDTLASPAFNGREAGTAGADSAADYIERRYFRLGLRPAFESACESAAHCQLSYGRTARAGRIVLRNIGAIIRGADPRKRDEYIVIGAHFDHLGHSPTFALDRSEGFVLRPGADDNASGTAAVLELARRFAARPTKRSLLLINFDAEEEGLLGSRVLLTSPPVAKTAMRFMIDLDMVGRLRRDKIFIESRQLGRMDRATFEHEASAVGIRTEFIPSDERSDDASFADEGIPAVWLSTGGHEDYHTASDVATRINIEGLARVVDLVEHIARRMADE